MIVADPLMTADAGAGDGRSSSPTGSTSTTSTILPRSARTGSRFEYVARRVPADPGREVRRGGRGAGLRGARRPAATRCATTRPATSRPTWSASSAPTRPLAGFERTFDEMLAGTDGSARYEVGGGNRIPLGENTVTKPVDGKDLHTTIDLDLQWYAQRVLRQTVEDAGGDSGIAVMMDSRTGEILALADHPTFDANDPLRREGRPRLARDQRRLRARLGREGADRRRRCSTPARSPRAPGSSCRRSCSRDGPGHRRLVPPRHPSPDPGRRDRQVVQHRHRARRRRVRRASCAATCAGSASGSPPTSGSAASPPGILPAPNVDRPDQRPGRLRPVALGQRACRWPRPSTPSPTAACGSTPAVIRAARRPTTAARSAPTTTTTRRVVSARAAAPDRRR